MFNIRVFLINRISEVFYCCCYRITSVHKSTKANAAANFRTLLSQTYLRWIVLVAFSPNCETIVNKRPIVNKLFKFPTNFFLLLLAVRHEQSVECELNLEIFLGNAFTHLHTDIYLYACMCLEKFLCARVRRITNADIGLSRRQ